MAKYCQSIHCTSEVRFYKKKDFHLHKIIQNRGLLSFFLPACLSVLLMNKTSTNSLIFYFDKAKQKSVLRLHEKIEQNILFC